MIAFAVHPSAIIVIEFASSGITKAAANNECLQRL